MLWCAGTVGSVVSEELDNVETMAERRKLSRQQSIKDNADHPLHILCAISFSYQRCIEVPKPIYDSAVK